MINFLKKFFLLRKMRRDNDSIIFKEKIWLQLKPILERNNKIEQEKKEIRDANRRIKLPTWGKSLLLFLFLNFTILECFVGWVTIKTFTLAFSIGTMPDFTPLVTLIGLVAGETISYGAYCAKSKAENTEGGLVHDSAMYELKYGTKEENSENDNAVG